MTRPVRSCAALGAAVALAVAASVGRPAAAPAAPTAPTTHATRTAPPVRAAANGPACSAPASGYRACLAAKWDVDHDGVVSRVLARVTLLERVKRCSAHGTRRVTAHRGAKRLGRLRASATCAKGVVRWRTTFTRAGSKGWTLHRGDTLRITWGGTDASASVELGRPRAKT